MNVKYLSLAALVTAVALPAVADEGKPRLLGCYQKVLVPAEYHVTKTKIKDAERKYVKRNGRYELLEYPAIFREDKKLIKEEYYVMQQIVCK
jgi:hypothetical protein